MLDGHPGPFQRIGLHGDGKRQERKISLPDTDGWYAADEKYGLPIGKESSKDANARFLSRLDDRGGFVTRGWNHVDSEFILRMTGVPSPCTISTRTSGPWARRLNSRQNRRTKPQKFTGQHVRVLKYPNFTFLQAESR